MDGGSQKSKLAVGRSLVAMGKYAHLLETLVRTGIGIGAVRGMIMVVADEIMCGMGKPMQDNIGVFLALLRGQPFEAAEDRSRLQSALRIR